MKMRLWVASAALLVATGIASAADKVVYHISDSAAQALAGLRNIRNHLDTEPTTQITVVGYGQGIDFMMEGAKDANNVPYDALVAALASRGVKFEVCEITLKNRNLKKDQFVQEANFTPSGVVRVTKLQGQGYAYLKP